MEKLKEKVKELRKRKKIPENTIIINGQSGDFITGGHIPQVFITGDPDLKALLKHAIEKHYSLWMNLKTKENIDQIIGKIVISSGSRHK